MSIVTNEKRVGRFTSSKISLLIPEGKSNEFTVAGLTYISEKYYERKLGRSLDLGAHSRHTAWGLFLEQYVFHHFTGMNYEILSNVTTVNPEIKNHAGSTDLIVKGVKISDIKCFQPRKFCRIVECFLLDDVGAFKQEFKEEYWQLVSNAMIHQVPQAESIIYMPTEEDLKEIREMSMDYEGADQWKYRFIYEAEDHELAYVPDKSEYKSLNKFEFEVPKEDFKHLRSRLELAEKALLKLSKRN